MPNSTQEVPAGYEPLGSRSPFNQMIGPLQARLQDEGVAVGLLLEDKHLNTGGRLHGAMVCAIFDSCFGLNVGVSIARAEEPGAQLRPPDVSGPPLVTVSLTTEYLGTARVGDWVEARATIQRPGRSLAFVSGELTCGGVPIAKGHGIFRVFAP